MITEIICAEEKLTETVRAGKIKCDRCNRELKSSCEWIRGDNRLLCQACYQNLLLPNRKISFEE